MNQFNDYQSLEYRARYGNTKPKEKVTHWCVFYKDKAITMPSSYAIAQGQIKNFKVQGKVYNKTMLKIKPYNY